MGLVELKESLEQLADEYVRLHRDKECLFWETKMGHSKDDRAFHEADLRLRDFLSDPKQLQQLREWRRGADLDSATATVLDGWITMLERNCVEDETARDLLHELVRAELELERQRTNMPLGYYDPRNNVFHPASSIALANLLRADSDPTLRKAVWEGLRSIEPFVLEHGFLEIVRLRNSLARALGYPDFYEYKSQWAEGFGKEKIFSILDDLTRRTEDAARRELQELAEREGTEALAPWNYSYYTAGSLAAERDPYFRFEDALLRWGQSFAAMGIGYRGATLTVDLMDRPGKYENGFMHGPMPAYFRRGKWQPASINFTANAVPHQTGAGHIATTTLFHEGGHAAHFANILTDAPCFSQEFAPTSVAFSETQSMLLDSLIDDPDWQSRYARDADGRQMPFELIERDIRMRQPAAASGIRRMMTVCYLEKEIYELPDDELTTDRVLEIARRVERELSLLDEGSPRPLLTVPHLLSHESSAYYHGYVLAQLAVDQTKDYLRGRLGHLVDNPEFGRVLAEKYWAPGNAVNFLDYVQNLTGEPLSADSVVRRVTRSVEEALDDARAHIAALSQSPTFDEKVSLDCELHVIHGEELIAGPEHEFEEACTRLGDWISRDRNSAQT